MNDYKLELENGKYTIIRSDDYTKFEALRYGESWQNLTGNKLMHSMVDLIQEQSERIKILESNQYVRGF